MAKIITKPTTRKIIKSRSQLAEALLHLDGAPFSLDDYPHMRTVYDTEFQQLVLKTSRQVGKSTTLANLIIIYSISNPFFRSMFIAPRQDQTKVFSRDRLGPTMMTSPYIKQFFVDPKDDQNVFLRQFSNGSKAYLRYAYLTADAIRGFSTDMNLFDEAQDLVDDVIPVANQTMTRSNFKKEIYSGTPKRTQGTLSDRWYRSTQNEWALKCVLCGHWNVPIDENNIGSKGVICAKCGKDIDPHRGQWVSLGDPTARMIGFRVCAPMFAHAPWVDWEKDIIEFRKNFGEATFFNEVMGLEYDDGVSPLTEPILRSACNPNQPLKHNAGELGGRVFGVDYGPINSTTSYTYLTSGRWVSPDVFQFEYLKRYYGKEADPTYYHDDIPRKFFEAKAIRIGADYGMGEASNAEIRKKIGYDSLIAYQYSDTLKERTQYNPKLPGYILNKSRVIDEFIDGVKTGKIRFPRWEEFRGHAREFTNLNLEYDETRNKRRYSKIGGSTDDALQAAVFCWMAAQIVRNSF